MLNVNCFTTSYNRPYYIYNTINNILNQTYTKIIYSVAINIDAPDQQESYEYLLKDIKDDRLRISYHINSNQHTNYTRALKYCDSFADSIYIKIDDDDIYRKNYIEKCVSSYTNNNADILSFESKMHLNNNHIKQTKMTSIGLWTKDQHSDTKFGMPSTYVFNYLAKKIIDGLACSDYSKYRFEDMIWREKWRENNLKSLILSDDIFIYNIHGNNISSKFLLDNQIHHLDAEFCEIIWFSHPNWQSYFILNLRNNRAYNIRNDDHASFSYDNEYINIIWDNWKPEKFKKSINKNNIVYYEHV